MAQYLEEERHMREENLRLQRKLQREMERREALCRQLSESESSLEMDDERCVCVPHTSCEQQQQKPASSPAAPPMRCGRRWLERLFIVVMNDVTSKWMPRMG